MIFWHQRFGIVTAGALPQLHNTGILLRLGIELGRLYLFRCNGEKRNRLFGGLAQLIYRDGAWSRLTRAFCWHECALEPADFLEREGA